MTTVTCPLAGQRAPKEMPLRLTILADNTIVAEARVIVDRATGSSA